MPLTNHRTLKEPQPNSHLWRYFDLPKFLFLINYSQLYFSTLESLSKEDPFEGQFTTPIRRLVKSDFNGLTRRQKALTKISTEKELEGAQMGLQASLAFNQASRKITYVNCWHQNKSESAAMWKLYSFDSGIAIKTSLTKIRESIETTKEFIVMGKVNYINYDTQQIKLIGWPWMPAFYKTNSYRHENEYRLMYFDGERFNKWTDAEIKNKQFDLGNIDGMPIIVNLEKLIGEIYTSPRMPIWQHTLIKSLLHNKGIKKKIIRSSLNEIG